MLLVEWYGIFKKTRHDGCFTMIESAITSKGRTTLPKPVRKALGVEPGDRVRYFIMDDEVRIVPVRPIRRLFGAFKHHGPARTLEDMDRAILVFDRRAARLAGVELVETPGS